jgi:hypothetical protein
MIVFLRWFFSAFKALIPFWRRPVVILTGIWSILKSASMRPAAWLLVSLYPVLEFLIEAITGHRGFMSSIVQWFLTQMLNGILAVGFHTNVQAVYNTIPSNVQQFSCYLGLTAALQILFDGVLSAMVALFSMQLTLFVFKLKIWMFWHSR